MRYFWQLMLLWLCLSLSLANGAVMRPAEISKVNVVPSGDGVKIEVMLTGEVSPRVLTATNPERLG